MIGSLRLRLTAFYTAVTGVILVCVTVLCLFVSQQDTRARTMEQFERYRSTVASYLSSQSAISADWLRQVEAAGNLAISIQDDGMPLYSMRHSHENLQPQFQEVRRRAEEEHSLSAQRVWAGKSCSFSLDDGTGNACIGSLSVIARDDSVIELILLHPLSGMQQTIRRQRLVVFLGDLLALVLLWAFCWYYTGRLLRPIQESQLRQARFTAAASHELRTPLAAILSAASAMERADPTQQSRFLSHIQSEGQRMSRLIGDLLTLSSGDSQNWALHKVPTELDMLLLEAYESYLPLAREKGLTLSISLPDADIPLVHADRERIYQVLAILLDNALSYTPAPGSISLSLKKEKRRILLLVSDTGPGVPDGEKTAIFQRFHRGETARSDKGHFGLGLSIAAQLVDLHGGKLWVRDAAAGGAEFVIALETN